MDKAGKDRAVRLAGIAGLAGLLVVVLWAGRTHAPRHEHDHHHPTAPFKPADREAPEHEPSGEVEDGVRMVEYDAFQYGFSPDPLVVMSGERVRILARSTDVLHGIVIPEINFQMDMPLSEDRKAAEFTAPLEPGEYPIICSVYCGPGHGEMTGALIVLPRE